MPCTKEALLNSNKNKWCPRCKQRLSISSFYGTNGYCKSCTLLNNKNWRRANPLKIKEYKRQELISLRKQIDLLLGIKCIICGFSDARALAIDHIYNDGGKERKKGRGYAMLRRVIKNPERYQRLCFNCNQIKEVERYESGCKKHESSY